MKTIVLYKSKSGFVKNYAQWIAEELSADLVEATGVKIDRLLGYDVIVYGGGLYVGGINGVKLITRNLDRLQGKRIAVFASGATPPRQDAIDEVLGKNFTADQLKQLRFFYLRGGFDYNKLTPVDKLLMKLKQWAIATKKQSNQQLHADETGMLAAYDHPLDFTRRQNVAELVSYIRGE